MTHMYACRYIAQESKSNRNASAQYLVCYFSLSSIGLMYLSIDRSIEAIRWIGVCSISLTAIYSTLIVDAVKHHFIRFHYIYYIFFFAFLCIQDFQISESEFVWLYTCFDFFSPLTEMHTCAKYIWFDKIFWLGFFLSNL